MFPTEWMFKLSNKIIKSPSFVRQFAGDKDMPFLLQASFSLFQWGLSSNFWHHLLILLTSFGKCTLGIPKCPPHRSRQIQSFANYVKRWPIFSSSSFHLRDATPKKTGFFGNFSQVSGPPPPPLLGKISQKYRLFFWLPLLRGDFWKILGCFLDDFRVF